MIKKNSKAAAKSAEEQPPAIGFLLELEYMLFPGRQSAYEAYSNVLKKYQITLEEKTYARYCLKRNIALSLKGLLTALGKKGLDEEEIASKITRQFIESVTSPSRRPVNALYDFLCNAEEKNIKIGLLSFLSEEDARQLMSRLKFKQEPSLFVMKKDADDLPTPDAWLSLLKMMAINPRCASAFVDSAHAHRSVLAVGMRSIVIPDNFTAWQDFSGADLVSENISGLKMNEILAILTPAHYRKRVQ